MTVYTDNAARFASRPETSVGMERRAAISDALHAIREYHDTKHAAAILLGSVLRQARWSPTRETAGQFIVEARG